LRLGPTDYKAWARGLRKSGYATNPRYPQLLIGLIERHKLYQYDVPGETDPINIDIPIEEAITGILNTNDVNYFVSESPITVQEVARQVDLSVRRLLSYNEELTDERQLVDGSERIYLQKKRRAYRGGDRYHTVQPGEDLYDIAQRYGVRLKILARRNRIDEDADPATGEQIKLRGGKIRTAPRLEAPGSSRPPSLPPPLPDDPATEDEEGFLDMGDPVSPNNPRPEPDPRPVTEPEIPVVDPVVPSPPATTPTAETVYHSVRAGETLYAISRRYGVSVDDLRRLNALTGNTISVGQQLRIR
jgi:LysM repeat protein